MLDISVTAAFAPSPIGVQRGVWADLPPETAHLLAPPVIVFAGPVTGVAQPELSGSRESVPVSGPGGHSG